MTGLGQFAGRIFDSTQRIRLSAPASLFQADSVIIPLSSSRFRRCLNWYDELILDCELQIKAPFNYFINTGKKKIEQYKIFLWEMSRSLFQIQSCFAPVCYLSLPLSLFQLWHASCIQLEEITSVQSQTIETILNVVGEGR